MGDRGTKPKPTALKLLHGTRPDRINFNEPKPPPPEEDPMRPEGKGIQPPDDISDEAREVWFRLNVELEKCGVLTKWDVDAYKDYCEAVVSGREAQAHLDEEGEVLDTPIFDKHRRVVGYRSTISPWWRIRMEAHKRTLDGAARFGLTPSDRTKIVAHAKLPEKGGESKGEDLLSG